MQRKDFQPLRECPFCGGEAVSIDGYREAFFVQCDDCGATFPMFDTLSEAAAAWNRRAQPENEPLTLSELRGMGGEPVWCDWIGGWGLIHIDDKERLDFTYCDGSQNTYDEIVSCGIEPLAYRAKPERSEG